MLRAPKAPVNQRITPGKRVSTWHRGGGRSGAHSPARRGFLAVAKQVGVTVTLSVKSTDNGTDGWWGDQRD